MIFFSFKITLKMNLKLFIILLSSVFCAYHAQCSAVENTETKNDTELISKQTTVSPPITTTVQSLPKANVTDAKTAANVQPVNGTKSEESQTNVTLTSLAPSGKDPVPVSSTVPPPPSVEPTPSTSNKSETPTTVRPNKESTTEQAPSSMTASAMTTLTTPPPPPPTTTTMASTTKKDEEAKKDREFYVPSFIGGIVLAVGLTGIGFVAYKFCKSRPDSSYRNL